MTTPTVEERIANLEGSFAQIATRIDRVEIDIRDLRAEMNARFDQIERQFTSRIDQMREEHQASRSEIIRRLDSIDQKFDRLNERIDRTNQRIDKLFYFLIGLIAANGVFFISTLLT